MCRSAACTVAAWVVVHRAASGRAPAAKWRSTNACRTALSGRTSPKDTTIQGLHGVYFSPATTSCPTSLQQGVALTGRNTTCPPRVAPWWVTLHMRCALQTTPTEDQCPRPLLVWPSYTRPMCRRANNVVNSEAGEWRVGQLRFTQGAECALCGWSSDTNWERPREYKLALCGFLRLHSLPVTFEVATPMPHLPLRLNSASPLC